MNANEHFALLDVALSELEGRAHELEAWGDELSDALCAGRRVLAAGNGGSAALAAHFTAELVGRYQRDRRGFSAIWLGADQATATAVVNDYGADEVFARQAEAHGRDGDVLLLMSTSGRSSNLLAAADRGHAVGLRVWALTGPEPNPLAARADRAVAVDGPVPVVQEAHQVAVHLLCEAFEARLVARTQLEEVHV